MSENRKIKVCHLSSAHTFDDTRIFHYEAVSLAKNGYEVYYVVKGDSFTKDGVNIIGVDDNDKGRMKRIILFSRMIYIKALELDADIYHFHDPELLPYGLKLAKKGKIVVFDSHENTVEQILEKEWIPQLIRKVLAYAFDKYQRYVCKRLDCIISVSPHICEYFEQFHKNVQMITNFPPYYEVREGTRKDGVMCFAGNISEQWNHDNVLKAIAPLKGVEYLLIGFSSDEYINELQKIDGWEKVKFIGEVAYEDVPRYLESASIGLALLSYNNNVGGHRGTLGNTKIYEEMRAGLPVVCTDFDLWSQMIERYKCGICVNPNNVDEIRNAIMFLLENPEEAKIMGQNAIRAVKEEYNWSMQEKILLCLYKELLSLG